MLGGGATAGPLHPRLTALAHARLPSYVRLQPPRAAPARRQAYAHVASEVMGPNIWPPAALPASGTAGLRLLPHFLHTNPSARRQQVFSGLCRSVAVFNLPWVRLNFREGVQSFERVYHAASPALTWCANNGCLGLPAP